MRVFVLCLVLAVAGGCPPSAPVQWPDVLQCGQPFAQDAIGKVTELLYPLGNEDRSLGRRTRDGLADLARVHTPRVVSCLVQRLVDRWAGTQAAGGAMPVEREIALERGQQWLAEIQQ